MKLIKSFKIWESSENDKLDRILASGISQSLKDRLDIRNLKASQAIEASNRLDDNKVDVFYIFLEYVDKYNLTKVSDIHGEEYAGEQINKYTINSKMRYTRHGAYGETTIEISFKDDFQEIDEFKNDMKEFEERMENQGSSFHIDYDFSQNGGSSCKIRIV